MAFWNRKKSKPKDENMVEMRQTLEEILLGATVDASTVTKEQIMTIPSVAACVNLISDTVASLPIRLYKEDEAKEKVTCIEDDVRVRLLNNETGDTLDGFQFKKALIDDYLVYGAGYAYINMYRNSFKSLHFVDNRVVSVWADPDPIFKKNTFLVYNGTFQDFQFMKLTRKTLNGATGIGVLQENNKLLSVAYNTLIFEDMLYRTGGNKKGFLQSQSRLSPEAITALKTAFKNLYSNNTENVVVLNSGVEFKEASNSSVEMQINQNKMSNDEAISKIFGVPIELLNGKATGGNEMLYDTFIKIAILPILKAFETALNKDLLLNKEKGSFYFAFDTTELLKGDIEKRFKAYELAVKNGILQVDEVRRKENYAPLGLDFIKLGLQDVLYDPITKTIYTPNTNQKTDMTDPGTNLEGGENNANKNNEEQNLTK